MSSHVLEAWVLREIAQARGAEQTRVAHTGHGSHARSRSRSARRQHPPAGRSSR